MVTIRLTRTGKKSQPYFRVIVLDKQKDPWGNFLENLGTLNPRTKEVNLSEERVKYWLDKGAQCSKTVHNLLVSQGLLKDKKVSVTTISNKRKKKLEEKKKEEKNKQQAEQEAKEEKAKADKKDTKEEPKEKDGEDKKEEQKSEEKK